MEPNHLPLAFSNLARLAWNRAARLKRRASHMLARSVKSVRESGKAFRAFTWRSLARGRHVKTRAYSGTVRTARYWGRVQRQTTPRLRREFAVRRQLRAAARGDQPIIVGPWLSEVGYEALYWVPFIRWVCHRYHIDRSRLVVVSRGGVASWYRDVADHYIELLELFDVKEFGARNVERQQAGEQKQHGIGAFDREILDRVRARPGLEAATVIHPSAMFRLLGQFWLGNESLHYVQEHTRYARVDLGTPPSLPPLPEQFVAMKFYTGKAIPDTPAHRQALRQLVERVASQSPVVTLDTQLALDEHEDFLFKGIPGVTNLDSWMTPQNNLGLQTAVIQRASRFVGTCGGLVWLAPFLGTETMGVYADDDLLTPHLYSARQAYRLTGAARFTALDLRSLDVMSAADPALRRER